MTPVNADKQKSALEIDNSRGKVTRNAGRFCKVYVGSPSITPRNKQNNGEPEGKPLEDILTILPTRSFSRTAPLKMTPAR